jgi:sporulation protein YqfC
MQKGMLTLGKKERVKRKIASALSLPKEIVLNLPLISIYGNEEITIENYKGMIEYSEEKIRINTAKGIISIKGRNLIVNQITAENISIGGGLTSVEFL